MLRQQSKVSSVAVVPGINLNLNPYAESPAAARILRNYIADQDRLMQKPFEPDFTTVPTAAVGSDVWHVVNYRYTRAGAAENKLVIFRNDGKVYVKQAGCEREIFPGTTSFAVLVKKPFQGQLSNRLFFSDGVASYVYDGRTVQTWGIARTTTAPTLSAIGGGSLTAATGLKAVVTWVVLDEAGNRVHESSRTNVPAFQALAGQNLGISIAALSPPARATHWSAYVSELDGSEVYRRAATTAITTNTVTVSALPASTAAEAPIRNDPPPPSTVGCVAKNRIFLRDEANPATFYFSALGEVAGLSNGAANESFCGYGSNSISDLVNSDFVPDREVRSICEHEDIVFVMSEAKGYAVVGELSGLDNRSPRSMAKLRQFDHGGIGADAIASTPYGLAWMSPGNKIWLWSGGSELTDIGSPLRKRLDNMRATDSALTYMRWYSGHNRQWLVVVVTVPDASLTYANPQTTLTGSAFVYDFGHPSPQPAGTEPGSWFEWQTTDYTSVGQYQDDDGNVFLLLGNTNGSVVQQDTVCAPTHLNSSAYLGRCYLGSTVQNNAAAKLRTTLLLPAGDNWATAQYAVAQFGDQISPRSATTPLPTLQFGVDQQNPDNPTLVTATFDTALPNGERRAWLIPESSGNTNVGGAFGKQFIADVAFSATATTENDADGRPLPVIPAIYRLAFTYRPQKETAR